MDEIRGLIVDIYRPADGSDCSNGGISGRFNSALVIGPGIPGIFAPTPDRPVVRLARGNARNTAKVVPVVVEKKWTMFGGAAVYSSDSRWREAVETICESRQSGFVPLHDRVED